MRLSALTAELALSDPGTALDVKWWWISVPWCARIVALSSNKLTKSPLECLLGVHESTVCFHATHLGRKAYLESLF